MLEKIMLKVIGQNTMHCNGCERTIKFMLAQFPGVGEIQADHKTQKIEFNLAANFSFYHPPGKTRHIFLLLKPAAFS